MNRVRRRLRADEVHQMGITGVGVTVAILDTGICRHPDFGDRIVLFRDFVNGRAGCYDDASHGCHVAGILAGDGKMQQGRYKGIAPGCRIISLKVLDRHGQGALEDILEAIDWVIQNRERYQIRILNISAGTTKDVEARGAQQLVDKVEEAWDCGLVVVAAAGNMGPYPMSITAPGNSRKVITVGAADRFAAAGHREGDYSGCGPTRECVCKPELVAPGNTVLSCSAAWNNGVFYMAKSGTSMAVPVISGAVALLLEQEPHLTNVQVKMRLKESSVDLGLPGNRQGWGMPDLICLLHMKSCTGRGSVVR